jgi:hypothetical protein
MWKRLPCWNKANKVIFARRSFCGGRLLFLGFGGILTISSINAFLPLLRRTESGEMPGESVTVILPLSS